MLHQITVIALGIGLLGLVQLGFGLAGWIYRPVAFATITLGIALFLWRIRRLQRRDITGWFTEPAGAATF